MSLCDDCKLKVNVLFIKLCNSSEETGRRILQKYYGIY